MSLCNGIAKGKWKRATRAEPSQICAKPDWCARSNDGVMAVCRRSDRHPVYGPGIAKTDTSGGTYWLYRLLTREMEEWAPPRLSLADGGGERADADTLDRVYNLLLEQLPLEQRHIDQ